ncbi:hypothetical protein BHM03_00036288, partial [Ensete ventricosum]
STRALARGSFSHFIWSRSLAQPGTCLVDESSSLGSVVPLARGRLVRPTVPRFLFLVRPLLFRHFPDIFSYPSPPPPPLATEEQRRVREGRPVGAWSGYELRWSIDGGAIVICGVSSFSNPLSFSFSFSSIFSTVQEQEAA